MPTSTPPATPVAPARPGSLRETKRRETWAALHEAAAELALRHDSLQHVTVEAIAERAHVSPRTFFNYFGSKEAAVLGFRDPVVDDVAVAEFEKAGDTDDLLERVVHLLFEVGMGAVGFTGNHKRRRELVLRHPELARRQLTYVTELEQVVGSVVAEHLARSSRWQALTTDIGVEQAAELIVMVGSIGMRFAVRQELRQENRSSVSAADREPLDRATALLRKVIRDI